MRSLILPLAATTLLLAITPSANAVDLIVRRNSDQRDGGKLSKMTKTEVTVTKQVGGDTTVPVNEIAWIEFDGAPASMGLGRSALAAGQLDVAAEQLEQALQESAGVDNPGLRGDLEFMAAKVLAVRGMTEPATAASAVQKLKDFVGKNREHYRFYDAQLLLGYVALAAGDPATAVAAFTSVSTAPWKDYQMAAQIGQGRTYLAQDNTDAAQREFDAVASVNADGAAQKARRLEAMLGQADCLHRKGQYQPAIEALDKVIDESTAADARLQAEAYLLQGACFTSMGANPKEAIMAYLHVDVIPAMSREADLHAEALYNLARLWNQVGQQDRAREAADALRGQYPNSEWAKKLGG